MILWRLFTISEGRSSFYISPTGNFNRMHIHCLALILGPVYPIDLGIAPNYKFKWGCSCDATCAACSNIKLREQQNCKHSTRNGEWQRCTCIWKRHDSGCKLSRYRKNSHVGRVLQDISYLQWQTKTKVVAKWRELVLLAKSETSNISAVIPPKMYHFSKNTEWLGVVHLLRHLVY